MITMLHRLPLCCAALLLSVPVAAQETPPPVPPAAPPQREIAQPVDAEILLPTSNGGTLAGSLVEAQKDTPVAIIIPGSGPTDRDGNNSLGVSANSYALLAHGLKSGGVSSVRIDKRGMFGSKSALADANAVTISDYAKDVAAWAAQTQKMTGQRCVWLLGHSEGGIVALAAYAQQPKLYCGLVLIATPGRPLGQVMRDQLSANPANAPLMAQAEQALTALEAGKAVDTKALHPALAALFNPATQPFLRDLMRYDPAKMTATIRAPIMIVAGERDLQVTGKDSAAFSGYRAPGGAVKCTATFPNMTHVLKDAASDAPADIMKTYADPALPLSEGLAPAIAEFIKSKGQTSCIPPATAPTK